MLSKHILKCPNSIIQILNNHINAFLFYFFFVVKHIFWLIIYLFIYFCVHLLHLNFVLFVTGIRRQVDDHHALDILDCLCGKIRDFNYLQLGRASAYEAMLEATKHGIVEFIDKMKVVHPCLLLAIDSESRGIFSYAILYRRVKIFNLIYGLEETREHITSLKDKFHNNLLHLAGMPAPPSELVRRSGAALQMQRELQWFQVIISHFICLKYFG